MKKIILPLFYCLFFVLAVFSNSEAKKTAFMIGITPINSPFKLHYIEFFHELEDYILSQMIESVQHDLLFLNIKLNSYQLKKIITHWKEDDHQKVVLNPEKDKSMLTELAKVDYCIYLEIPLFQMSEEADFYDPGLKLKRYQYLLRLYLVEKKTRTIVHKREFEINQSGRENENLKQKVIEITSNKIKSVISNSVYLQAKFPRINKKLLFITLAGGYQDGIRRGDFYQSEVQDPITRIKKKSLIKIVKVDFDQALGLILLDNLYFDLDQPGQQEELKKTPPLITYRKLKKIDLELQLTGGVLVAGIVDQSVSVHPALMIRTLIPVKAIFFKPIIQVEFNFIIKNNRLILPFFFETGFEGEFNFHRFGISNGILIGAFFSPDKSNNYRLDSFTILPYLQLSGLVNANLKFFGEIGYKYIHTNHFKQTWKIDLSGIYFSAGMSIIL